MREVHYYKHMAYTHTIVMKLTNMIQLHVQND
jgi:hypothetical protein